MAWLYLFLGAVISLAANFLLKASNGFENLTYGLVSLAMFMVGIALYGFAIKVIPLNVAYVIWTGASVVLLTIVAFIFFDEKITLTHLLFISMIIVGSVGLKLISKA
jgi:small multidrug resistance pump